MAYSFTAQGHPNIRSTHPTTMEFTSAPYLTASGDCIVGVKSDFDINKLKPFLTKKKITLSLSVGTVHDTLTAVPNPSFSSGDELVLRMSDYRSPRTFAVRADKAAKHLKPALISLLKDRKTVLTITIS